MDSPSTQPLMTDHDLEAGPAHGPAYSTSFINHASNNQRTPSTPLSLVTGTGYHIYTTLIIPYLLSAKHEVLLVTCFWAPSATLTALHAALLQLSRQAVARDAKISVHICFSTCSLARNMFLHTPNRGQSYGPEKWHKLGLPEEAQISGLELRVTRKFFRPWGIVHSKYVVVDREVAILPSCNVSWERWFEVAVAVRGEVVGGLLGWHAAFWENDRMGLRPLRRRGGDVDDEAVREGATSASLPPEILNAPRPTLSVDLQVPTPTTLLPSPHTPALLPAHLRPNRLLHALLPCLPTLPPTYPPTPLLTTTAHLLSTAAHSLVLISPNITAPTVLSLLRDALARGVDVTLWTNQKLMTAEQLVTAGSTTPRCLSKLEKWHASRSNSRSRGLGKLRINYFDDRSGPGTMNAQHVKLGQAEEEVTAVKLHAKVTLVDGERMLLGSGNMDAASWGTSQELGVLVEGRGVVGEFLGRGLWPWGSVEG